MTNVIRTSYFTLLSIANWNTIMWLNCLFSSNNSSKCPGSISYIYFRYFRIIDTLFEPSDSVFHYPETNRPSSPQHPSWLQINLSVFEHAGKHSAVWKCMCVHECSYKAHTIKLKIGCEKKYTVWNLLETYQVGFSWLFLNIIVKYNTM